MDLSSIPRTTWVCLGIIFLIFLILLIVLINIRLRKAFNLEINYRNVEYFPTIVSTLGVLFTFFGIAIGLYNFNPNDLDNSIPGLLDGLKTAFYTSLAGMIGSIILSIIINHKQDKKDNGISDINQAAIEITNAVKSMSDSIDQQARNQNQVQNAFYKTAQATLDKLLEGQTGIKNTFDSMSVLQRSQNDSLESIEKSNLSISNYAKELQGYSDTIARISNVVSNIDETQSDINTVVSNMPETIHNEIAQINENMDNTNKLLEQKFEEFSELLKKSNTEALVEVMKKVTEEFQKEMSSLINKLVQENFDQLNKSVEKLNKWQQENKEMIETLTHKYKEMSDNFDATSTSLTKVKEDTTALVSEGGKLRQLVDALNQVIIEDEQFIKITKGLQETADLTKSNMESFDESTKVLNEWIRKQRKFVDGVQLLIDKLEELNKIRDYGEQFWKGTKEKMEEGVSIISNGSEALNRQLKKIDQMFYNRLSATLGELDNCITKMVEQVEKRK